MEKLFVKLDLVFYCNSSHGCKRSACIVHGEQCYYLTGKTRSQKAVEVGEF